MKVTLLSTDTTDVAGIAAKACTSDATFAELLDPAAHPTNQKAMKAALGYGHRSIAEHTVFSFGIEGISRTLSHQLVRKRIASYAQQSQRYVKTTRVAVVTPPSIAANPEAARIFSIHMQRSLNTYSALTDLGIPKEDARFVLTAASTTRLVATMNAGSWLEFLAERLCTSAQWEIRALATEIQRRLVDLCPEIFACAGPKCLQQGFCREGLNTWKTCQRKPHTSDMMILSKEAFANRVAALSGYLPDELSDVEFTCDRCPRHTHCETAFNPLNLGGWCAANIDL